MPYGLLVSPPSPLIGILIEASNEMAHPPRRRDKVNTGDMVRTAMGCLVATICVQYGIDETARARPKLNDMARHIYPGAGCCLLAAPASLGHAQTLTARRRARPRVAPSKLCLYPQRSPASLGRRGSRAAINRARSNRVVGSHAQLFLARRGVLQASRARKPPPWGTGRLTVPLVHLQV
jgi:hypothetical protein